MSKLSIAPIAMTALTLFVGVYWLLIYFRRRASREELTFALLCFAVGIYDFHCAGLYSSEDVAVSALWQRGQLISAALIAIAFAFFISDYTKQVPRSWLIGMASFFFAAAAVNFIDLGDLTWILTEPVVRRIELPFGIEFAYYEATPGPVARIQIVALALPFACFFLAVFRQYRHGGKQRAKMLIAAMTVFFLTVINDVLLALHFYRFVYTAEYGYFAIVLLMSYSMSDELVEAVVMKEERKNLEEQLRQAQKLEAIGRLAGGIAHDLNNQLTPIMGYADMALSRQRSAEELRGFIGEISESAEHAKELARQLLAFGRKQMLDMAVLNINDVILESKEMLRRLIREDIEIGFALEGDVGNIRADASQMRQVLMNLALNAEDAMPQGGKISIGTENVIVDKGYRSVSGDLAPGGYVMLGVTDTGYGMDKSVIEHIFEPFFTTKENGKGSGWGLATVWGIVKQHGGGIFVYSEPGHGSTFKVYFPRSEASLEPAPELLKRSAEVGGDETILVVEDEEAVRKMVCEMLKDLGYTVLAAGSPVEAIDMSGEFKGEIHLLLTDVVMPKMNGKELFTQLSLTRDKMKVLYMSGYAGDIITNRGIRGENTLLVTKPFSTNKLSKAIRTVLD